jgi:lipopolysaccharide/colanic/teichoic acid biosynthesis glycosyltransferase
VVLKSLSVDGEILTDEHDPLGILGIDRYNDRQTLVVSVEPLHLRQRIFKRMFDIAFSGAALLILLPVLVGVAIAVRLDSSGPIFFRQDRIGRDNRIFSMFKFRSMYIDQSDSNAAQLTRRGDSRVTRVGAFIRAFSLDELPQLLNVLNGTMSVVGPRPHAISAKAGDLLYWDVDDRYRFRHSIKPGLTGLAQVRGFRGATERAEDLTNRLSADLEYLSRWSISRDIWIILQTFGVLRHVNAF